MKKQFHIKGVKKSDNKWGYELVVDDNGEISTISMESSIHPTEFLTYTKFQQQLGLWLGEVVVAKLPSSEPNHDVQPHLERVPIEAESVDVPQKLVSHHLGLSKEQYAKELPRIISQRMRLIDWNPCSPTSDTNLRGRRQLNHAAWVNHCIFIMTNVYGATEPTLIYLRDQVKPTAGWYGTTSNWCSVYNKVTLMDNEQLTKVDPHFTEILLNEFYIRKQNALDKASALLSALRLPDSLRVPEPTIDVDWVAFAKLMLNTYSERDIRQMVNKFMPKESFNPRNVTMMINNLDDMAIGKGPHPLTHSMGPTSLYRLYRVGRMAGVRIPTFS